MHILVIDDQDLVRETVSAFLRTSGRYIVDECADLDTALSLVAQTSYGLIILDFEMPQVNGLDALLRLLEKDAGHRVALMSGSAPVKMAEAAVELGAVGYVPKSLRAGAFVAAVDRMIAGDSYWPEGLLDRQSETKIQLTSRETEVLAAICEGKSNKEIARLLDLQEVTVKVHVKSMGKKIGAKNRTHAAMIARREKLI